MHVSLWFYKHYEETEFSFYKASQAVWVSPWSTLLCWHWAPRLWAGGSCCIVSLILWGRFLRVLRPGVRVVAGVKPHSSSRVLWEALQWQHLDIFVLQVQSFGEWLICPEKATGPKSPRTGVSHFKQKQSGLILQCLGSYTSFSVESSSKNIVNLAFSCPEQTESCIYTHWLQEKKKERDEVMLEMAQYLWIFCPEPLLFPFGLVCTSVTSSSPWAEALGTSLG